TRRPLPRLRRAVRRALRRTVGRSLLGVAVTAALAAPAAAATAAPAAGATAEVRVLVKFRQGLGVYERRLLDRTRAGLRHDFPEIGAVAVAVSPERLAELRADPAVELVETEPVYRPFGRWRNKDKGNGKEVVPSRGNGLYGLVIT